MSLTKLKTLQRVKTMLVREWNLTGEPLSSDSLRDKPPKGLGKSDKEIRALETPIESVDFADVNAAVKGSDLVEATSVGELRTAIWDGIPNAVP